MNETPVTHTGGCMCGAIRYEIEGSPSFEAVYCHCSECRHHTGAPATAAAGFPAERVRWSGAQRTKYDSTPGEVARSFCPKCGTSLTWEGGTIGWEGGLSQGVQGADIGIIGIHIGTLDNPDAFPPTQHIFCRDRVSWFETNDELPRYPAMP